MATPTPIDNRIKYRVGSPRLPTLPVETRILPNPDAKFPGWVTHLARIGDILDQNEITPRFTDVAYRLHSESELHDKYITITTRAEYKLDSGTTWPRAVGQIREYLNGANIHHAIEIIAHSLYRGLRSFPLARDIYQWNEVLLPDICNLLNGRQWITLDMVYREDAEVPENRRPTILIGARDADEQYWWDDTLPALRQLHQVTQFDIEIELLYRYQFLTAAPNGFSLQESFEDSMIELGASCGRSEDERTGTFGGRMRLKNPDTGAELTLGITNHHVLGRQLPGKGPFTTFKDPIKVESPSSKDRDVFIKTLEARIDDLEHDERGLDNPVVKVRLQDRKDELARAQTFDLYVGQVFASSGFRWTQNNSCDQNLMDAWAVDWSLTTVEKRATGNRFRGLDSIGWRDVKGYCSIDPRQGYRVFKKGRTSGATAGFISATQSMVRTQVPEPEDGLTAPLLDTKLFSIPIRCHVMIADLATHRDVEFIQPGDSGSLILLDPDNCTLEEKGQIGFKGLDGEPTNPEWEPMWKHTTSSTSTKPQNHEALIAGLAFGGAENHLLSYMMPMDLVVQDIESVTKWKVVEPIFAGVVKHNGRRTGQEGQNPDNTE
ncbi:hypothetical protein BDV96DRAFT_655616 [Lophiotrema nucula]|uniref:Uncharacterized protein n=1 Tax=Lophiotrema nucula TaxID=690887 RepID=A0A6A5YEZ2_9PLEO|nr:hypothetical protein BDV96DRAFT_655616 [Lophiotrema nucula]